MARELLKDLLDFKEMIDKGIGTLLMHYEVANVATFWIHTDISDNPRDGGSSDQPEFFEAVTEYMDAIAYVGEGGPYVNARLSAALTNGQEIILHQVGDFSRYDEH